LGKPPDDYLSTPGHYALDPYNIAKYPAADFTVERIGDLVDCHLSPLLGKAGSKSEEESAQ
jgi:hypothetical protein